LAIGTDCIGKNIEGFRQSFKITVVSRRSKPLNERYRDFATVTVALGSVAAVFRNVIT